jgi:LmbE family N-acetylglucosaminyl deacetylase
MTENGNLPLKIMTFFAHPDDETMFLGGTLAYLADQGAEIHFICATRGEGGEMGEPPICSREDLGSVREGELRCAVTALGGKSVQFLDFIDPVVGPEGELFPFSDNHHDVIERLIPYLIAIEPQVILTHGADGEYGHPAHIQAHQAMMAALEKRGRFEGELYSPAWLSRETGEFTPKPGFVLDISSVMEKKIEAVTCHRSQHGLFLRHGTARAGRPVTIPEMVRTREAITPIFSGRAFPSQTPMISLLEGISHLAEA